jgi:putative two-component system response regulator
MSLTASSRKPTILIVDDEESNRHLFETLLKLEGYSTQTANNGEAALAMVADWQPDLILLDVMMPGMDGFQVATKLKSDPATEHIPVIMATSLDDRGAMLAGLNAGAEEFLTKPLDRTEMKVRVRNILRLKEYSDMLSHYNTTLEQQVYERTMRLRDSNMETIFALTRAAEYKDEDTTAHVRRIGSYSKHLA